MSISTNDLFHELVVTITHPVPDPQVPYIKEVRKKLQRELHRFSALFS
jgi:hypothetical protein